MERARTKDGVHQAPTAQANKYSQEELRLMKTQDANYLGLKAQAEAKVGQFQQWQQWQQGWVVGRWVQGLLRGRSTSGKSASEVVSGQHATLILVASPAAPAHDPSCRKWSACSNRCT
jgi:hypothetical protein